MQYLHNMFSGRMFSGRAKLAPLENERYPGMRWTKVKEILAGHAEDRPKRGAIL